MTSAVDKSIATIQRAWRLGGRLIAGEFVDVATGEVVLERTDLRLDGVLPLCLTRTHVSSFERGRWFGPTWASTLDQRIEIDSSGVMLVGEHGALVSYSHAEAGVETVPEHGAAWPLVRLESGAYMVTDPRTGRRLHFAQPTGVEVSAANDGILPLVAITERNANRILIRYDSSGVPAEIVHSGGYRVRIDSSGTLITRISVLDDGTWVPVRVFEYSNSRLTAELDGRGEPFLFGYDGFGRLIEWVDRNSYRYEHHYDDEGRCVRQRGSGGTPANSFEYEPYTDDGGSVTTMISSSGARTRYRMNARRQVVSVTDPLGNTTSSAWNGRDELMARRDPLGNMTRYRYNDNGDLTGVMRPDGEQTLIAYQRVGLPSHVRQADGRVWTYTYDAVGNQTAVLDPSGLSVRLGRNAIGALTEYTNETGNMTTVECDGAGLPVVVTDPVGGVTRFERDGVGRVVSVTDPLDRTTRLEWSAEGRLLRRAQADGSIDSWAYDGEGNVVEHVDPVGNRLRYQYAPFGKLTTRIAPDGSATTFTYDAELRLTSVTNPAGFRWRYRYDACGRLVGEIDYDERETTYAYDPAGRIVSRTAEGVQTVAYTYDAVGNLTGECVADSTTTFTYDPVGRILSARNSDCTVEFERDRLGRVTGELIDGRRLGSAYDPAGRRVSRRTPRGVETQWQHDAAGRVASVTTDGHALVSSRDHAGQEVRRSFGVGFALDQRFDVRGRLTGQTVSAGRSSLSLGGPSSAEKVLVEHEYSDLADASVRGSERSDFEYNGTLLERAGRSRYRYDGRGRLIQRTVTTSSRSSRSPDVWHYEWDDLDRLRKVVAPGGQVWWYRYDPFGRRVAKQRLDAEGAVVSEVLFSWDGNQLAEQAGPEGELITVGLRRQLVHTDRAGRRCCGRPLLRGRQRQY